MNIAAKALGTLPTSETKTQVKSRGGASPTPNVTKQPLTPKAPIKSRGAGLPNQNPKQTKTKQTKTKQTKTKQTKTKQTKTKQTKTKE